VLIAQKNTGM